MDEEAKVIDWITSELELEYMHHTGLSGLSVG